MTAVQMHVWFQSSKGIEMVTTKLKRHIKETRLKGKLNESSSHLKEALEQISTLEAHVAAIKKLQNSKKSTPIKQRHGTGCSEATAIAVMSDVHMGEKFTREMVNGLNEYSVAICKARSTTFFERIVRLTNKERQDVTIDELILFLGGD